MTDLLTEDEVLAAIPGLTRSDLIAFIETGLVAPLRCGIEGDEPLQFRRIDFARVQLLCDLSSSLDLNEHALGVVIALIDQLHAMRRDFLEIARAVQAESPDIRARIGSAIFKDL